MLQKMVANWIRQQAQDAVMNSIRPDAEGSQQPTDVTVDVICLFPTAAEAGGMVDSITDVTTMRCEGFIERIGRLDKTPIAILESAESPERLAKIVQNVISLRKPKWVLSCGFAVGLGEDVARGHLVVADRIVDADDYSLNLGTGMPESKGLHVGPLLTLANLPSVKQRSEWSQKGIACDTQAAIVAEVCRQMKVRMMAVHCVALGAGDHSSSILDTVKSQDSLVSAVGAAAGAILERPGNVREFWNDKALALRVSDRLAKFLAGVISQLS